MLGHIDFVKEIVNRKVELAKVLDSRRSLSFAFGSSKRPPTDCGIFLFAYSGGCFLNNIDVEEKPSFQRSKISIAVQQLAKTIVEKLYDAVADGSVSSLHNLLQKDSLVLERVLFGCVETPLHISLMLGHIDFVKEIVNRKVELAKVLDSRRPLSFAFGSSKRPPTDCGISSFCILRRLFSQQY
ncbi:hypothetical protein QYF36_019177 [Acer negundo]|nr:hypothetical protein QYF36_019177 [Acer negundo]